MDNSTQSHKSGESYRTLLRMTIDRLYATIEGYKKPRRCYQQPGARQPLKAIGSDCMSHRTCEIDGCTTKHYGRGLCKKHYTRLIRNGSPHVTRKAASPEEYFQTHIQWSGDCLVWQGPQNYGGYGQFNAHGKNKLAHRFSWERNFGPVPENLFIDHICHNRLCVNIEHLRLATRQQNNSYQSGPSRDNKSSGIRNVYKRKNGWQVAVRKNRKLHHFGTYLDLNEAIAVAENARLQLFGDFAGRG